MIDNIINKCSKIKYLKPIVDIYVKYKEIINYLVVGGLTTVVGLVTYYACVLTFLDPNNAIQLQCANIISWVIAVIFAYFTNRKYVFESKNENKVQEGAKFMRIKNYYSNIGHVSYVFRCFLVKNER